MVFSEGSHDCIASTTQANSSKQRMPKFRIVNSSWTVDCAGSCRSPKCWWRAFCVRVVNGSFSMAKRWLPTTKLRGTCLTRRILDVTKSTNDCRDLLSTMLTWSQKSAPRSRKVNGLPASVQRASGACSAPSVSRRTAGTNGVGHIPHGEIPVLGRLWVDSDIKLLRQSEVG